MSRTPRKSDPYGTHGPTAGYGARDPADGPAVRVPDAEGAGRVSGGPRPGGVGRLAWARGWGGVASMAVACAVTAAVVLVPLTRDGGGAGTGDPRAAHPSGRGITDAQRTDATSCKDPERSLRPSTADGPTIDRIKKRGFLIVGVDQSSYRWGYLDPNKVDANKPESFDPEGFDIDLVHAIADQILGTPNAKVLYRAIPTNERIGAVQHGTVDMVVRTMTITCERTRQVAFSTAYFKTGQQILAPEHTHITGYNTSLTGKRVCAAKGATGLEWLSRRSFGSVIVQVPNQLDCLVRLQLGQADAVVTDGALAAGLAAQDPAVKLVGARFDTEYYGVAMKKDADDLVRRVNLILEEYRKSGWQASYNKWLKADLGPSDGPPAPEYR
jgi:polar amino acid transport system substrate-binding protein